jgi:hypothetical protein
MQQGVVFFFFVGGGWSSRGLSGGGTMRWFRWYVWIWVSIHFYGIELSSFLNVSEGLCIVQNTRGA